MPANQLSSSIVLRMIETPFCGCPSRDKANDAATRTAGSTSPVAIIPAWAIDANRSTNITRTITRLVIIALFTLQNRQPLGAHLRAAASPHASASRGNFLDYEP